MTKEKLVDQKSYDLAEHFLADKEGVTKEITTALARDIQSTVEAWFDYDFPKLKKAI